MISELIVSTNCNEHPWVTIKAKSNTNSKCLQALFAPDKVSRCKQYTGRNVSAIFIYKWKGEELVKALQNDSTVYVHITIAAHTSSRQANINRMLDSKIISLQNANISQRHKIIPNDIEFVEGPRVCAGLEGSNSDLSDAESEHTDHDTESEQEFSDGDNIQDKSDETLSGDGGVSSEEASSSLSLSLSLQNQV
nr:unnamed protein product [Callosobruchus analis]